MKYTTSARRLHARAARIAAYVGLLCVALVSRAATSDDMVELPGKLPVASPPNWASMVDAQPPDPANKQVEYLLVDRQLRVEKEGTSSYVHYVMHLGNQSAVDEESHVQIVYRPVSERIVLHGLRLRRGAESIDQLQRARMSTLRRELELEQGILDGELTQSIVLEDVRVGDVLEYSYTRETRNDELNTGFSAWYPTQWSAPVRHSYLRILHPQSRRISIKNTNAPEQPQTRDIGGWQELVWQWRGLTDIPEEESRPGWIVRYPFIQLSEYENWQGVARWAQRLYENARPSPEMKSLVAQWSNSGGTTSEQIVRALRFVQDEIRYTGIEIGPGRYRPEPPDAVLKRRFGDCKEKAFLLVTLLHALNVEAQPALVSTYRQQGARDLLPSPAVFDHVIVRVRHDGKVYWFDATRSLQGGTLDTIEQARFGAALVIADSGEFETIPAATLAVPDQQVIERYDLTAGVFAKAKMDVETAYLGAQADSMRHYFADNTIEDVSRRYVNYYKDTLPTISMRVPVRVQDDRERNRLVVHEAYDLDPAFTKGESGAKHFLEFDAHAIKSAAAAPKTLVRTSALQLDHPTFVQYRAVVRLPEPWKIEILDKTIADPAFNYHSSTSYANQTVTADFEFKTLVDHIPASSVPEYARKLSAVRDDAYYYLSYSTGAQAPFKMSLAMIFALAGGVVAAGFLIRWLHRYDNPRFPGPASAGAPEGLTGWMVLPTIGTIASPLLTAFALYSYRDYFDASTWTDLGSGQDPVVAHWGKIGMFFVIALACAAFLLTAFLNYLLFAKRRSFPPGYIAALWIGALWDGLSIAALSALGALDDAELMRSAVDTARTFIFAAIWTAYLMRSERVRATFVRSAAGLEARGTAEA